MKDEAVVKSFRRDQLIQMLVSCVFSPPRHRVSISQSVSMDGEKDRRGSQTRAAVRGQDGTGERGHFKGLSTVSNSG